MSTLTRQVSLLEKQLEEFRHLAEERTQAFDELQAQFDELNAAQDSVTLNHGLDDDWTVVREELHRQATYMRQLETANTKMTAELNVLREKQTSVEVLKEQRRELERKLRGAEDLRERVVKLEAELDAARQEREEWYVLPYVAAVPFLTSSKGIRRPTCHPVQDPGLSYPESFEPTPYARKADGRTRLERCASSAS